MKKIKIILSMFIFLIITILSPINSQAVLIVEDTFNAYIDIIWYDYNDKLGQRPDSITIPLYSETDSQNIDYVLSAKDCTVTDLGDGIRTKWRGVIKLSKLDSKPYAKDYAKYSLRIGGTQTAFNETYDCISALGSANYNGFSGDGDFEIDLWSNLNQYYTFKVEFDDDNDRDHIRNLFDTFTITSNIDFSEDVTFTQSNNYTYNRYLQTYQYDTNNIPIWDNPAEYSLAYTNNVSYQRPTGETVQYDLNIEKNGTEIIARASYIPDKLQYNIPVKINFNTDKYQKPENLKLNLQTDTNIYKTVDLNSNNNYSYTFSDLYLRENGNIAVYTVSLENTTDWEFEVTGNQQDGFIINATYIGKIVDSSDNTETTSDDNNQTLSETDTTKIIQPSTVKAGGSPINTSIIKYFILGYFIVITVLITFILKFKRKKYNN